MKAIVTSEFLQRTLKFKCGRSTGTCFFVKIDSKFYFVTAEHLLFEYPQSPIEICGDEGFKPAVVLNVVNGSDVSGRKCTEDIAPDVSLVETTGISGAELSVPIHPSSISIGDDAYFLGFPLGLGSVDLPGSSGWQSPFVKRGCISAFVENNEIFYVDGSNNTGFSGGPVLVRDEKTAKGVCVGVISGYVKEHHKVHSTNNWYETTDYLAQANSGICIATSMNFVRQLAKGGNL